jgi:DNA-binding response OmpR family regulator
MLIVEDDENLSRGISFAFERGGFDIVILDLSLPDGDGTDFCREVRAKSGVPVIMLTARDMEADELSGLQAGADDYITKPFSLSVLRVRRLKTGP